MEAQEPTVLFLLGKTGQGKSETGNNILGRQVFDPSDSSSSKTINVRVGYARRLGREFKVIDGPGVGKTRISQEEAEKKIATEIKLGVNLCPEGIHALILVLRYGNRFTDEEWATVCGLKKLFGESFIRDYCIILFTLGDVFHKQNQKTPARTFQDWCLEQEGKLKELFSECRHRIVLFNNFSEPEKADSQLKRLLYFVDKMKDGVRYTNDIFEKAGEARKEVIAKDDSLKVIQENIQSKLQFIMDGIERLKSHNKMNDETHKLLENLRLDATKLQITIDTEDKGTGALKLLRQKVTDVLTTINNLDALLREHHTQAMVDEALAAANKQFSEAQKKLQREVDQATEPSLLYKMTSLAGFALKVAVKLGYTNPYVSLLTSVYETVQSVANSEETGGAVQN